MDIRKFTETLISSRARSYCILDGAAVPDLPKRLYEMDPPNYALIAGELTPDMVHVAPYLAIMIPDERFTKWVLQNGIGKNQGIFVQTRYSLTEMRRHFRALMTVHDEEGNPMLFRFYDPRVFRKFLPSCDAEQVTTFFGKVDTFFVEAEEKDVILAYTHDSGELSVKEIELSGKEG